MMYSFHSTAINILTILGLLVAASHAWDFTTTHRMVLYSFATKCPSSQLTAWNCSYCRNDTVGNTVVAINYDAPTDTRAILQANHIKQESTTSLINWIEDLNATKTVTPFDGISGAYVHSGFYTCYMAHKASLFPQIMQTIKTFPTYSIIITGHSLGGAQATLAAVDFVINEKFEKVQLHTFGSPRVGNTPFSSAFASMQGAGRINPAYRNVHQHDIVPHLPPILFDFHHVRQEVWNIDNQFRVCDLSGEDPTCSDSIGLDLSTADHTHYMGEESGMC